MYVDPAKPALYLFAHKSVTQAISSIKLARSGRNAWLVSAVISIMGMQENISLCI